MLKKITLFMLASLFLCSTAYSYSIGFDGTGSENYVQVDEFGLNEQLEMNSDLGVNGDLFSYQDEETGLFTEQFTLRFPDATNTLTANTYTYDNLYVDVSLDGQYVDNDNIYFTSGLATIYDNTATGDLEYTPGDDTKIAGLTFKDSLISSLSGSLLGASGLQMTVDATFDFDEVNELYFDQTAQDLVSKNWLLSFVNVGIQQEDITDFIYNGGVGTEGANDAIIEWDLTGAQAEFEAVPEPTTMLLFGTGLLGLAGLGRRRFFKKS